MLHRSFFPAACFARLALLAVPCLAIFSGLLPTLAPTLFSTPGIAADGAWREKTQVVWSKDSGTLIRRNFKVWDPHPELDLDFLWEPRLVARADADPIVNGAGTLTWHTKGAPNYDRRFTYSVFKGVLKNGRPDGQGALVVRTGLSYTGQWLDGEMHGRGLLKLANGDRYEGDFIAGKMHGVGKYSSTDGTVYFGEFRNGARDGIGRLLLVDGAYRTVWRDGQEIARERIADGAPAVVRLQPAALSTTVKLKLSLDQKKAGEFDNADPGAEAHAYEAEPAPGRITIRPASKEIWDAWKTDGQIATGREGETPNILEVWHFPPVFLAVDVENNGASAAQITGAYLDIEESVTDLTPYLELGRGFNNDYSPTLEFQNYGWGRVRDAKMTYSLGTETKRTDETVIQLGSFDGSKPASLVDGLRRQGVDVERLRRASTAFWMSTRKNGPNPNRFNCEYEEPKLAECFQRLQDSGVLGKLKDFVFRQPDDGVVLTMLVGRIEYRWTGSDGKTNDRVSSFKINVPLLQFNADLAEESGPEAMEQKFEAVGLSPDNKRKYRLSLPKDWNVRLAQGDPKQLSVAVAATKSSHHVFQLVLQLADGTQVTSPVVDLTYLRPKVAKKQQ
jgi:hypothetical protein